MSEPTKPTEHAARASFWRTADKSSPLSNATDRSSQFSCANVTQCAKLKDDLTLQDKPADTHLAQSASNTGRSPPLLLPFLTRTHSTHLPSFLTIATSWNEYHVHHGHDNATKCNCVFNAQHDIDMCGASHLISVGSVFVPVIVSDTATYARCIATFERATGLPFDDQSWDAWFDRKRHHASVFEAIAELNDIATLSSAEGATSYPAAPPQTPNGHASGHGGSTLPALNAGHDVAPAQGHIGASNHSRCPEQSAVPLPSPPPKVKDGIGVTNTSATLPTRASRQPRPRVHFARAVRVKYFVPTTPRRLQASQREVLPVVPYAHDARRVPCRPVSTVSTVSLPVQRCVHGLHPAWCPYHGMPNSQPTYQRHAAQRTPVVNRQRRMKLRLCDTKMSVHAFLSKAASSKSTSRQCNDHANDTEILHGRHLDTPSLHALIPSHSLLVQSAKTPY